MATVLMQHPDTCRRCGGGSGMLRDGSTCPLCKGTGKRPRLLPVTAGGTCGTCNGSGTISEQVKLPDGRIETRQTRCPDCR